jgi:3-hydroxyisobutyrate dehydrogenase
MKVGLIGTGLMGLPMGQRLLDAGFEVMVYNRTVAKVEPLRAAGAAIAPDPAALLQNSTGIILMLTNAQAIRAVLLSEDSRPHLKGKTVIQMGTIAPSESRALETEIAAAGGEYLEAPVLGSIPEAKNGTLMVMVGSTPEQFQQWQPILQCFGSEPRYIGPVGTAAAVKLALNQLIGSLTTAFATSLGFIQQQNADVEQFLQILRQSALYAPTFDKKLQRMLDRNYENPNFPTKHLLKDTQLFLTEAEFLHIDRSLPAAVQKVLEQTMKLGLENGDYCALFSVIDPDH